MKVSGDNVEKLRAQFDAEEARSVPGYISSHVLVPDERPGEVWIAVFFQEKDSYTKNADDPAQHEEYLKMRALLDEDPEWIDGTWESSEPLRPA